MLTVVGDVAVPVGCGLVEQVPYALWQVGVAVLGLIEILHDAGFVLHFERLQP